MPRNLTPTLVLPLLLTAAVAKDTFVDLTGATAATFTSSGYTDGRYSLGVALMDGAIGEVIPVVVSGTTQVIAAAAIPVAALLQVAPGGQAITKPNTVSADALVVSTLATKTAADLALAGSPADPDLIAAAAAADTAYTDALAAQALAVAAASGVTVALALEAAAGAGAILEILLLPN